MKTATLINEIITSLERLIISIKNSVCQHQKVIQKRKNITI